jgi:hypothetical protein
MIGWDKQDVRGRASGGEQWYPTLRKEREGWATRNSFYGRVVKGSAVYLQPALAAGQTGRLNPVGGAKLIDRFR